MHWMYLNKEVHNTPDILSKVEAGFASISSETFLGIVSVCYDDRLWTDTPVIERDGMKLIWCGWFIYDGKINPLKQIFEAIKESGLSNTLQRIEAGIFVGLYQCDGKVTIFNDWFGLSAHFFRSDGNKLWLSPFARTVSDNGKLHEVYRQYLSRIPHLWGKNTKFDGVERLTPSSLLHCSIDESTARLTLSQSSYGDFGLLEPLQVADIPSYMKQLVALFPAENKYISLSAGFDSRVLALVGGPSFSYTWGPSGSKDARNGSAIAEVLNIPWMNFNFSEKTSEPFDKEIDILLTEGQIHEHDAQFFRNYRHVSETLKARGAKQYIVLDGFFGDGLQRGTYCYGSSVRSEIKKLFPAFFTKDSAHEILRDRYRTMPKQVKEALLKDFDNYDFRGLDFSRGAQKVTAFECMNNRCFAYIYSGGIAANSVWNVVIAPFAFPRVFKALAEQPVADVITYKTFKQLWSHIRSPAKKLRSEGLYSPNTARPLIPFYNFIGRVVTNYVPLFFNYTKKKR